MVFWLNVIGLGFQLVGAAVTALWGFRPVLRRALLDPVTGAVSTRARRLVNRILRLFRKPHSETIEVGGIGSVGVSGSARISVGYAPLADELTTIDEKVAELDRRTQELAHDTLRNENQLVDQARRHNELSRKINHYTTEQTTQAEKRDIRGARLGVAGLLLVAIGAGFQLAALFITTPGDAERLQQLCTQPVAVQACLPPTPAHAR